MPGWGYHQYSLLIHAALSWLCQGLRLDKLSEPKTAGRLKGMGVRYALVHREGYLEIELIEEIEELDRIPHNPGLKLVRSFSAQECPRKDIMCVQKSEPMDVYEMVAVEPIEPK